MINASNIGKRIKKLRKERDLSQERMAEDLGMYQADISNLKRAVGGSGISDLYKLDMIADYFGVPLVEILVGSEDSSDDRGDDEDPEDTECLGLEDRHSDGPCGVH